MVAAFFYAFVWPSIKNNIKASTYCATAVCYDGTSDCHYLNDKNQDETVDCTSYYEKVIKEEQKSE